MKIISNQIEFAFSSPPAAGFQKNDWFKTLVRLKAHFTGILADDVPEDSKTRKWMEIVRMVLPPEPPHFPLPDDKKEPEFLFKQVPG